MQQIQEIILIGGSDPSGGAGLAADLRTLFQLGLSAQCIVSAVTAQNEKRFVSYQSVSLKTFSDQLRSLRTLRESILKIGMMGDSRFFKILQPWVQKQKPFVILDPVLTSSTGGRLLDVQGIRRILEFLPWVDLLTPNLPEAEKLTGLRIHSRNVMLQAGEQILKHGTKNILLKGGHLKGKPLDILMGPDLNYFFEGKRLKGSNTHGTGCTLASAIAGNLALGHSLVDSISKARLTVKTKILAAIK